MQTKILSPHDLELFTELLAVFADVFEMTDTPPASRGHLEKMLANPGFRVFVAIADGRVIGGLTVYLLDQYFSEKPLVYIHDLAVATAFQRQGAGKKLISAVLDWGASQGLEEAFVQAELEDDHAIAFYRSTPIKSGEEIFHFMYGFDKL